MIWLYRGHLDYWAEHEETLGHIVRHVLIHEIGHISACRMPIWRQSRPDRVGFRKLAFWPGDIRD